MTSVYRRGKNWVASYRGADGLWKAKTAGTDKSMALQLANKLETDSMLRREGFVDATMEKTKASAAVPLAEHVAAWIESLRSKGVTRARTRVAAYRLNRLAAKADTWAGVTPELLRAFLKELRSAENASNLTHNGYVQMFRQFCQWMVREGRATNSPAASLAMLNAKTDRRHVRRAFTVSELRELLAATAAGPVRYGMTGGERVMLYRLAAETGLRSGELRALTRQCFRLDDSPPTINLDAAFTKNRQYAVLELRADTTIALRTFFAGKLPRARAFNMPPMWNIIDILKADLEAAGIPYADDVGRVLDFHSFRHTCGAWLAASGAHPKVIQSIMRHSDIRLTMDTYGHRLMEQESQALAKLPDLSLPPESESLRATGTMDSHASISAENALKTKGLFGHSGAVVCHHESGYNNATKPAIDAEKPHESRASAAVAQLVERSFRKA